jgi:hypothetical protein
MEGGGQDLLERQGGTLLGPGPRREKKENQDQKLEEIEEPGSILKRTEEGIGIFEHWSLYNY